MLDFLFYVRGLPIGLLGPQLSCVSVCFEILVGFSYFARTRLCFSLCHIDGVFRQLCYVHLAMNLQL